MHDNGSQETLNTLIGDGEVTPASSSLSLAPTLVPDATQAAPSTRSLSSLRSLTRSTGLTRTGDSVPIKPLLFFETLLASIQSYVEKPSVEVDIEPAHVKIWQKCIEDGQFFLDMYGDHFQRARYIRFGAIPHGERYKVGPLFGSTTSWGSDDRAIWKRTTGQNSGSFKNERDAIERGWEVHPEDFGQGQVKAFGGAWKYESKWATGLEFIRQSDAKSISSTDCA